MIQGVLNHIYAEALKIQKDSQTYGHHYITKAHLQVQDCYLHITSENNCFIHHSKYVQIQLPMCSSKIYTFVE